jgi:putative spermidine/putrescine transport system permease protein
MSASADHLAGLDQADAPPVRARNWTSPPLWLLLPALGFLAVFFAYPLVDIVLRSLRTDDAVGLTLANYQAFLGRPIYLRVLYLTLEIALVTTVLSLVVGYPIAYVLANARPTTRAVMMTFVMLPFMTAILVRTYSWMVILRPNGVVNGLLIWLGLGETQLIYNRTGVLIGMVYTMLPYMVLTLYSVMRGIDGRLVAVAKSLGASSWSAFWRIYFPLSMPGVAGASMLVFILSAGFYITPRLMGGDRDQMLASIIAYQVDVLMNFNLASAMAVVLLVLTLLCFVLYARLVGLKQLLSSKV